MIKKTLKKKTKKVMIMKKRRITSTFFGSFPVDLENGNNKPNDIIQFINRRILFTDSAIPAKKF